MGLNYVQSVEISQGLIHGFKHFIVLLVDIYGANKKISNCEMKLCIR